MITLATQDEFFVPDRFGLIYIDCQSVSRRASWKRATDHTDKSVETEESVKRRDFVGAMGGLAAMVAAPVRGAEAVTRIIVGYPPGGSVDAVARLAAHGLTVSNQNSVVVENRPGAAGRIAVEFVKGMPADGRTLLVGPQGPMTLFPHIFKDLRFDPTKDFTPVARLGVSDMAFSIGAKVPADDFEQLKTWLQSAGPEATFGSPGAGTIVHFTGEAISQALGAPMIHVPYQGSARSMVDLVGGEIAMVVSPVTEALELHRAGRIRIVATTGPARSAFVPEVPCLKELGYDVEIQGWNALYGPAGLPRQKVEQLRQLVDRHFNSVEMQEQLAAIGIVPAPLGSDELEQLILNESQMWQRVVTNSGFSPEA